MQIILKYFPDLSEEQKKQFSDLEELYTEWNHRINVVSRRDIGGLYEKHVLHSLSIAVVFDFIAGSNIIDIGTGGGFPGIPLAIFFPQVRFHLVDSIAKKLKVTDAIANEIHLKNVMTHHIRVEEINMKRNMRGVEGFDFAVSRAVAPLKDLWEWAKPLLKHRIPERREATTSSAPLTQERRPGLICLKGGDLAEEISESATKPQVWEIFEIFPEEFFKQKFILYVPR